MAWTLFGRNWLTGIICMWHGLLADIPNGWALCNGFNGTPDLRGIFVRGTLKDIDPGGFGGSENHSHGLAFHSRYTTALHDHPVVGQTDAPKSGSSDVTDVGGSVQAYDVHQHDFVASASEDGARHAHYIEGDSEDESTEPKYFDIAFIMKL